MQKPSNLNHLNLKFIIKNREPDGIILIYRTSVWINVLSANNEYIKLDTAAAYECGMLNW